MRIVKFLLVFYFLAVPFFSFAQKWERWEKKADEALDEGKYRKANRKAKKLERKSIKKLGKHNPYLPFVGKVKAAYALQEGEWQDFENYSIDMLAVSDTVFEKEAVSHAYYQYQYAKLWAEAGFMKKAYDTLRLSKATYKNNDWPDKTRAEKVVLEGDMLCEMGQYSQALQLIKEENDFMQTYGTEKRGNKKEQKARYAQLAAFINLSAKAWIGNGSIAKADSVLKQYEVNFKKKLDKNDWARVNHALLKARLFENINNLKEAEKQYKEAYELSVSKRRIEDKRIIPYREALIDAYYRFGKTKDGSKAAANYTEIAKKAFKRKSFHRLEAVYIEGSSAFYEGKIKDAEKKLQTVVDDQSLLPNVHPLKLQAKELLYAIQLKDKRFSEGYQNLLEQSKAITFLYGEEGVRFHEKEMMKAAHLFDYTDELKAVAEILKSSYEHFLSQELMPQHKHIVLFQNQLAQYYSSIDDYKKALQAMEMSAEAARMKPNNNAVYGRQLVQFADLLFLTGKLTESVQYLEAADKILNPVRLQQENTQAYAGIMFQKARMMGLKGDFDQAEKVLSNATKFLRRQKADKDVGNTTSLELLADVYQSTGQYSESERLLKNAIASSERMYGKNNRRTLDAQLKLGQLKLAQGDYAQASQIADQVTERSNAIYGENSLKTAAAGLLKADLSAALGDYAQAALEMEEGLEIYSSVLGESHLQNAQILGSLSLALLNGNLDKTKATALLQKAMDITEKQIGVENPTYADLLTYAAYVDIAEQKYSKAFEKLAAAEKIWAAKSGKKNNANAAIINALLGDVFYNLRDYRKARQHYQKATKLYDRYFNNSHPDYVKTLAKISRLEYMEGNEKKSIDLIETVMDRYDHYLQEFFPILSEREKARFWNMIKDDYEFYNSLILKSVKNYDDKRIAKLFDNAINTKALLLNTSIRLRQNILDSGNEKLINDFNDWIFSKENLSGILTLNPQELAEIGVNKDSLIRVVENLERSLSQQSDVFGELAERRNISWKNVKDALKENEVAVEMIRFRHFDHVFTDSIIYAALVLRNKTKQDKPEIIVFEEGNALESKYFNNYRNSIVYRMQDEVSYEKFWKPIEDLIGKTASIYFSPEGIYNQMNLEVIPYPDGRYIVDNFDITLINNTKDIYLKTIQSKPTAALDNNKVMLYGDPQFYVDASAAMDKKRISSLPGTHAEVQGISKLFESRGWETNVFLEAEANEGKVKEMINPKVFHIATHGFYDPSSTADDHYNFNQTKAADNPLLRAGLLLKGAGDIIARTSHNYNIDNGILTAYEAMNLNLSQTDLVVLSACETGVGELSVGEGVDGLQKAFLVAGAKVLIMSLFKVNDEVTKTLMVNFYNRWLETGKIRESFAEARNIVRSKHPDPIHWGAFVVFGLE